MMPTSNAVPLALRIDPTVAMKGSVERHADAIIFHDREDHDRWLYRATAFLLGSEAVNSMAEPIQRDAGQ